MSETIEIVPPLSAATKETYYEQRMQQLGITAALNRVNVLKYNPDTRQNEKTPIAVFREHARGIEIIVYTIEGSTIRIQKEGSKIKKDWSIIRYENPIVKPDGSLIKYLMPKGQGSYPLFPPNIMEAYENKSDIHTLFLTEGFFKAWKGFMHGMNIIGVPSITHLEDREKKSLNPDILKLISRCNIKRVVWLTDADCLDISKNLKKANGDDKDLKQRPAGFLWSVTQFKRLLDGLKEHEVEKYFMHIDAESIVSAFGSELPDPVKEGESKKDFVKGLDDLLVHLPHRTGEIIEDAHNVSRKGDFFERFNITYGTGRVYDHFRLATPEKFYLYHVERRPELKERQFVFGGTAYKYNDEKGECEIVVPGDSKLYFRCGDDYYKFIYQPNKYRQLEKVFKGRRRGTIVEDHGKDFPRHIPKYETFCNVPDNVNFQQVIHGCFNVYSPMEHRPDDEQCTEEDCPTILSFIRHIFGEKTVSARNPKTKARIEYLNYQLGLDYIQVLYQQPAEKLPILCLVSRENNTGKTTFGKLLKVLFGANVAIVGNQDLAGDFNAHWATKLVVVCDETKIDKQHVVEKVKSLSTADKVTMNAKGKDHVEIDCFIKFIFITNNEDTFISASEDDIRYWVHKVPVLKEENPGIIEQFVEEIPAFLNYLNHRKLATEKLNRMWFYPELLRTDALKRLIVNNKPTIVKEVHSHLRSMFFDFGLETVTMARIDIHKEFFNHKYEVNYLEKMLKEEIKADVYHTFIYKEKEYETQDEAIVAYRSDADIKEPNDLEAARLISVNYKTKKYSYPRWDEVFVNNTKERQRVDVKCTGRPYMFYRKDFLTAEEMATHKPDDQTKYENNIAPTNGLSQPTVTTGNDELPF
jgi:hypothetical protein